MDKEVIDLIKTGIPAAQNAVYYYYVYWSLCAFLSSATFLGAVGIVYHLFYRWQNHLIKGNRY